MVFSALIKSVKKRFESTIKQLGGHIKKDSNGETNIPVPEHVENLSVSPDASTFERAVFIVKSVQKADEAPLTEPPDVVLSSITDDRPIIREYPLPSPENYEFAYYPAGGSTMRKPNIESIKHWVEYTKIGNSTRFDITAEFGDAFGYISSNLTQKQQKNKIDEVAFKVARKLWYVGRKPSSMTDDEWNEETKHMRPPEGSFSKNDIWVNVKFPYDETYMYRSGYIEQ